MRGLSSVLLRSGAQPAGTATNLLVPAPLGGPVARPLVVGVRGDTDELTGLPGYGSFRAVGEELLGHMPIVGPRPALLLADLDTFSRVNHTHGPVVGDEILKSQAERLRQFLPEPLRVFRVGGDQFALVVDHADAISAVDWGKALQQVLSQPVDAGGTLHTVTACVAVVLFRHGERFDRLARDADTTMCRAKTEGRNRVDLHNWEADSWAHLRRHDLEQLGAQVELLQAEAEDLRRKNRLLADAIRFDPVTHMPNRLAFEADHQQLFARWKRMSDTYTLLRVHLDQPVPDHAGEAAATIQSIGAALRDTVRQYDRAYLSGPADFAVLLHGADLQHGITAAERIRRRVEGLADDDGQPAMTVTIAAAEAGLRHGSVEDLLAEVEQLLVTAVAQGCNRVVWPY